MLLVSPDPRQKVVTVEGQTFRRHRSGYFEVPNVAALVEPLLADGFTEWIPQVKEGSIAVPDDVRSAEFHAVVIRCGCGNPSSHAGAVCPRPAKIEDRGKVAAYYRNPFRALAWKITQLFNRFRTKEA